VEWNARPGSIRPCCFTLNTLYLPLCPRPVLREARRTGLTADSPINSRKDASALKFVLHFLGRPSNSGSNSGWKITDHFIPHDAF
jgi:hypothetical protein